MKPQPSFDIDFDKRNNATVVIACAKCGHENRHHLTSLSPDEDILCSKCATNITMDLEGINLATRRAEEIRQAFGA
ncbi:hypothetical protein [Craterilacuibacter sp.]|uniref:hypothetical protein n=1 Tax=Craterilacuibacter sp. TaxID=2870909 RepID=UPI003F3FE92A